MTTNMSTMRAMTIPEFGGPEVLALDDVDRPEPGPGQVTIDVSHAGVNFAEVLFRQGEVDVPLPFVPGIEIAGHVRALGDGVEGLVVGQPVAALTMVEGGGYGEVVGTDARLVAPLPGDPDADALATFAATPSNTTTALLVLRTVAPVTDGSRVLVHGAAGGVGSQLGQVARLLGAARVVGVVGRPEKVEAARAFGYDEVLTRDQRPEGLFDVVVDPVGGVTRSRALDLLDVGGRLVAMGNASGADDVTPSANALWFASTGVVGHNTAAVAAAHPERVGATLREAVSLVVEGRVHVDVVEVLPLAEAAEAHRRIEGGATTGKLVLDVG